MSDYVPSNLANPYPENGQALQKITQFEYLTPLHLRREIKAVKFRKRDDAKYIVAKPYKVKYKFGNGDECSITIPKGMLTDLASVPRWARWLVSRVGPHLEASVVHDFLYIAWQDLNGIEACKKDWNFADNLMNAAMKEAKVNRVRRRLIYLALRTSGWYSYKRRKSSRYYNFWSNGCSDSAITPLD